ncbi:hypothetical protein IV203_005773 [Nitzschia inconspicua]|uniref:Uncharacterized protein n=1 Tax=Nitzschia inconspicua TaxID=303405 RepID=A0A9K3KP07_9STRA|nr:hypothetical protein IV203_005773 [Nitzschia inconspicua]
MRSGFVLVAASLMLVEKSLGFLSWNKIPVQKIQSATSLEASRREILNGAAIGFMGSIATVLPLNPQVARADITNKVASSPALRSLKRAQQNLPKLLPTVQSNDYVAVKSFLRTPPFDDVRKNGFILVRGGEDSPKASELEASYKSFIASLEKIDGTASLGMRGRTIKPLQMSEEYDNIVAAMDSFLKLAEETAEIPVQYPE